MRGLLVFWRIVLLTAEDGTEEDARRAGAVILFGNSGEASYAKGSLRHKETGERQTRGIGAGRLPHFRGGTEILSPKQHPLPWCITPTPLHQGKECHFCDIAAAFGLVSSACHSHQSWSARGQGSWDRTDPFCRRVGDQGGGLRDFAGNFSSHLLGLCRSGAAGGVMFDGVVTSGTGLSATLLNAGEALAPPPREDRVLFEELIWRKIPKKCPKKEGGERSGWSEGHRLGDPD